MSKNEQNNKKLFSHPRWHESLMGDVVGRKTLAEEEQKKVHEDAIAVLKSMGKKVKEDK